MNATSGKSNLGRNILIALGLIAAVLVGGYQYIIHQPTARGSFRCFVRQTFYEAHDPGPAIEGSVTVTAAAETKVVRDPCDSADDPAIFVNTKAPEKSLVLGTNKARGVNVYNLDGEELHHAEAGAINNIDIRQDFMVGGKAMALVGGSNKGASQIMLWELDPETAKLNNVLAEPIATKVETETYGFCLFHRKDPSELYAFVTDKSGAVEQWRLKANDAGKFSGEFVRKLRVNTQPEGCVVDDANARLFVGEEDVGIWTFDALPEGKSEGTLIAKTGYGTTEGAWLTADLEGLALYIPDASDNANGYLVASSQGNDSYVLFDRIPPYAFRGAVQVKGANGRIAGDTDGLAVTSANLGPRFPRGLLVVQDGTNETKDGAEPYQNFKIVSWQDIMAKGVPVAH